MDVLIGSRGNELTIDGSKDDVEHTRTVLEALWQRIRQGQDIDEQTVDSALRFLEDQDTEKQAGNSNGNGLKSFSESEAKIHTKKRNIQPRSPLQAAYIQAMKDCQLVFAVGPAGTGKTYLAVAKAVAMLENGDIERIILSRPAVEAGERLGFLPGELKEKMDPYLRPLYDALHDTMAAEKVQKKLATEEIEIAPLAYMRGRSLNNAFIILDEAQNTTQNQMLMFLTRMGENSHMVVTGDPSQIDLPKGEYSGLMEAKDNLSNVPDIAFIEFSHKDVVRSAIVAKIIQAYDKKRNSD